MTGTLLDLLDLRAFDGDLDEVLPAPADAPGPVDAVREIIAAVRSRGDDALRGLTAEFDGVTLDDLQVPSERIAEAWREITPELRAALQHAADAVRVYHEAQIVSPPRGERDGVETRELVVPVARAGCYVPGGRAVYPSTVLMTAIPARVA
ncbi:MAG TPA: histidinol dehydrogenase, partial [Acidimicrobiia bacterium]|nr:histidinol dehydrogenase [Acidimicrobiia bacterium]